ncbi:hypothetical protein [Psychroflexus torquis]|uniref:hypothetical protein n=1 Tax=Psychroflexus torquis TaxID=57029 RepID=UPI0000D52AF7|nr:hypothetical protein [Psychroflexus torquis]
MKISLRFKQIRHLVKPVKQPLERASKVNECSPGNFMSGAHTNSRKVLLFNVIDDCNHKVFVINEGLSYLVRVVVETLKTL